MNSKDFFLLLAAVVIGATVANLLALKIAADQVQKQLDAGALKNPILKALTKP